MLEGEIKLKAECEKGTPPNSNLSPTFILDLWSPSSKNKKI